MSDVTKLLSAIDAGDPRAGEQLLPLVYEELRTMAAKRMARESPGQTLQATALVHEAWIKSWAMDGLKTAPTFSPRRRILVDNARRKQSVKHGGAMQGADWSSLDLAAEAPDDQVLAVLGACDRLPGKPPHSRSSRMKPIARSLSRQCRSTGGFLFRSFPDYGRELK